MTAGVLRLACAVVVVAATTAQAQANAACAARVAAKGLQPAGPPLAASEVCLVVANDLVGAELEAGIARAMKKAPATPVDLEPTTFASGSQGGPAQASAAPSIQPTPNAGASVSAVSTKTGVKAVTEIKLNLLGLLTQGTASHAWGSRTFDVLVDVPTSAVTALENGTLPPFDYLGVRVRFNFLGTMAGNQLAADVLDRFAIAKHAVNDLTHAIQGALEGASDQAGCIGELESAVSAEATKISAGRCRSEVVLDTLVAPEAALRAAYTRLRNDADSRYLGLDLRGDFGDPRYTGLVAQRGTRVQGGVAFGQRVSGGGNDGSPGSTSVQVQGRLGVAAAFLQASGDSSFAIEGALAVAVGISVGGGRNLLLNAGFDGRGSFQNWGAADTNYATFVAGVTVPIVEGSGITLGLTIPIVSADPTRQPSLVVNGATELIGRVLQGRSP